MQLPQALLLSLKDVEGFDKAAFEKAHTEGIPTVSIRWNPEKIKITEGLFNNAGDCWLPVNEKVLWSQFGSYLSERPSFTFDPLFHAGLYYVQEASSMFMEQAFRQLVNLSEPLKILDLSAAPGGKSTHILSLISKDSLLVSNEVIKSRCITLVDNIIKWGYSNIIVTNNDPSAYKNLPGYFDVIVVDAPCSGSGLFRKDAAAIEEWSLNNVTLCNQRQQRILADVLPALKQNGLLIYSTCSYSKEENEDISDWLVKEFEMKNEKLQIEKNWGIVETQSSETKAAGYRFYPDKVKGEGFFISCFRKTKETKEFRVKPVKLERATTKEKEMIMPWLKQDSQEIIKEDASFFVFPASHIDAYRSLKPILNIQYVGTEVGQIMKDKLIPSHSLALSTIISESVHNTELSYAEAIKFLQKNGPDIEPNTLGWQTVSYKKNNLGWINALPGRINNYYPKQIRILKQQNDSAFKK